MYARLVNVNQKTHSQLKLNLIPDKLKFIRKETLEK